MSEWQPDQRWSYRDNRGKSWQRRAQDDLQPPGTPVVYPPAGRGRGHKRGSSSREPHAGGQLSRPRAQLRPREAADAIVPPPPPPTRPTPRTMPSYAQVDSFDSAQAPWSRDVSPEELNLSNPIARHCNNRWCHYGRKFTSRGPNGRRPTQVGQNSFQCYECNTVSSDLYAASGHTRAEDE